MFRFASFDMEWPNYNKSDPNETGFKPEITW